MKIDRTFAFLEKKKKKKKKKIPSGNPLDSYRRIFRIKGEKEERQLSPLPLESGKIKIVIRTKTLFQLRGRDNESFHGVSSSFTEFGRDRITLRSPLCSNGPV